MNIFDMDYLDIPICELFKIPDETILICHDEENRFKSKHYPQTYLAIQIEQYLCNDIAKETMLPNPELLAIFRTKEDAILFANVYEDKLNEQT